MAKGQRGEITPMELSDGTSEFYSGGTVYGWVHAFIASDGTSTHYWAVLNNQLPAGPIDFKYVARNAGYDNNLAVFCAAAKQVIGSAAVCSRYRKG